MVLDGVDLALARGEVLALLGRNGAGKTTLLKAAMGLVPARAGVVMLDGVDITARPAHQRARLGVAYVPQGRGLFAELSVRENLMMGVHAGVAGNDVLARMLVLFPVLAERLDQSAGTLSGGEQQMLATARALCVGPKVLLLDEPSEGLMPSVVRQILEVIAGLRADGVAVLLVEQHIEAALGVADRVCFIENGRICAESTPAALAADPAPLRRHVGIRG